MLDVVSPDVPTVGTKGAVSGEKFSFMEKVKSKAKNILKKLKKPGSHSGALTDGPAEDSSSAFASSNQGEKQASSNNAPQMTGMTQPGYAKNFSGDPSVLGRTADAAIQAKLPGMLPRRKISACFGFCDIRNFVDVTECLQEDVMMFVNLIADMVHNKVVLHSGFPNNNAGDAFLNVWLKTISDNANKSRAMSVADRALQSFLDIIQCIETSRSLAELAKHPAIQECMPGYRVHMGFGLHFGWAIEGAIGSTHKVDLVYYSPHVNLASRLEAATKQYGVMLLISETVITHLTNSSLRDNCRKLDRVIVKGTKTPVVLYTFDITLFQQDLRGNPADYRDLFEKAVDNYIEGEWATALKKLEDCLLMWPTDKPAKVLINFMASQSYIAPEDWRGYRELKEK